MGTTVTATAAAAFWIVTWAVIVTESTMADEISAPADSDHFTVDQYPPPSPRMLPSNHPTKIHRASIARASWPGTTERLGKGVSGKRSGIVGHRRMSALTAGRKNAPNIAVFRVTEDGTEGSGIGRQMPEALFENLVGLNAVERPNDGDGNLQHADEGPGSVETYTLNLFEDGTLPDVARMPTGPGLGDGKVPKEADTLRIGWKAVLSGRSNDQTDDSHQDLRERQDQKWTPPRKAAFGNGRVPELQIGCEGLADYKPGRADARSKRSDDAGRATNYSVRILSEVGEGMDGDGDDDDDEEESDELFRLKKLYRIMQGPRRGDMQITIDPYSSLSVDDLPNRGDLGELPARNVGPIPGRNASDSDVSASERQNLRDDIPPLPREHPAWIGHREKNAAVAGGSRRTARSVLWGFAEEDGAFESGEVRDDLKGAKPVAGPSDRDKRRRGKPLAGESSERLEERRLRADRTLKVQTLGRSGNVNRKEKAYIEVRTREPRMQAGVDDRAARQEMIRRGARGKYRENSVNPRRVEGKGRPIYGERRGADATERMYRSFAGGESAGSAGTRRTNEKRRQTHVEEEKLRDYVRRNQPVAIPSRSSYQPSGRNSPEVRKAFDAASQYRGNSRYPPIASGRADHGPSAPTGMRWSYPQDDRSRDADHAELERARAAERRTHDYENLRKEALRREEEYRRQQSRRYEEERRRQEMARLAEERRPGPGPDSRPGPQNVWDVAGSATIKPVTPRGGAGQNSLPSADPTGTTGLVQGRGRLLEYSEREGHRGGGSASALSWQRHEEEARLKALPVRARIVLEPRRYTPVTVTSRTGPNPTIDHSAVRENRRGMEDTGHPTSGPPPSPATGSPSPCVWAIVQCCPINNYRLVTCFESLGCPGANWTPNPCSGALAHAARAELMNFYARDDARARGNL